MVSVVVSQHGIAMDHAIASEILRRSHIVAAEENLPNAPTTSFSSSVAAKGMIWKQFWHNRCWVLSINPCSAPATCSAQVRLIQHLRAAFIRSCFHQLWTFLIEAETIALVHAYMQPPSSSTDLQHCRQTEYFFQNVP
jgi:hypothetical protein